MAAVANNVDPTVWRSFVERVLAVWSGYQLNLDYNNAGQETQERHKWLVDVLAEHIYVTRGMKAEELEQWITGILYNDFDLILDDDSTFPTSCLLLEAFGYMKSNNVERFNQLLAGMPTPESIQQTNRSAKRDFAAEADDADVDMEEYMERVREEEEEGDSEAEGEDNNNDAAGPSQRERQPRTTTDDDGWTTILRR